MMAAPAPPKASQAPPRQEPAPAEESAPVMHAPPKPVGGNPFGQVQTRSRPVRPARG